MRYSEKKLLGEFKNFEVVIVTYGILKPVEDEPSVWCHPLVVVPKPSGGVCIATDL